MNNALASGRSILLVEDDEVFGYAAGRYLRAKGHRVIHAPGSSIALRELDRRSFDIVIADVVLQDDEPHGVALARMSVFVTRKRKSYSSPFAVISSSLRAVFPESFCTIESRSKIWAAPSTKRNQKYLGAKSLRPSHCPLKVSPIARDQLGLA
jgi:hypothetical protein